MIVNRLLIRPGSYRCRLLSIVLSLLFLLVPTTTSFAQSPDASATSNTNAAAEPAYSRLNTGGIFAEFAPNSSHILIGVSNQRRLITAGFEYGRRIYSADKFQLYYLIQARPFVLEGDPTLAGYKDASTGQTLATLTPPPRVVTTPTTPINVSGVPVVPFYGRQWTYEGGLNPIVFRLNFRPHHRLQPFASTLGGFLYATRQEPVQNTMNFNFCFQLGVGFEAYITATRSIRISYSFQHISNAYIGATDPGIDTGLIQVGYSFGH